MPNLTLSGYLATAQGLVWTSGQSLDTLTDNKYTDASDAVDNSTNKYAFADFEIVLASAAFIGVDSGIELFIVPSVDGTNYPTFTGNTAVEQQHNAPFARGFGPTTGTTAAQRIVIERVPLPNGFWRAAFRSRLNVSTAGSGNSATWRPHSFASA